MNRPSLTSLLACLALLLLAAPAMAQTPYAVPNHALPDDVNVIDATWILTDRRTDMYSVALVTDHEKLYRNPSCDIPFAISRWGTKTMTEKVGDVCYDYQTMIQTPGIKECYDVLLSTLFAVWQGNIDRYLRNVYTFGFADGAMFGYVAGELIVGPADAPEVTMTGTAVTAIGATLGTGSATTMGAGGATTMGTGATTMGAGGATTTMGAGGTTVGAGSASGVGGTVGSGGAGGSGAAAGTVALKAALVLGFAAGTFVGYSALMDYLDIEWGEISVGYTPTGRRQYVDRFQFRQTSAMWVLVNGPYACGDVICTPPRSFEPGVHFEKRMLRYSGGGEAVDADAALPTVPACCDHSADPDFALGAACREQLHALGSSRCPSFSSVEEELAAEMEHEREHGARVPLSELFDPFHPEHIDATWEELEEESALPLCEAERGHADGEQAE